jgi:hypothetical protein
MKKLSLSIESLKVETFEASRAAEMRGTVAAHNDTFEGPTCMGDPAWTCRYHCTWYPGTTCE